jgi:hypothetical protein
MTNLFLTGYELPMLDRDDKSPHCSCGSGDGSDEHGDKCELVTEGLL